MDKLRLKSELIWELKDQYIQLYDKNPNLIKGFSTEKNAQVFDFLKFLSTPRSREEVLQYEQLTDNEKEDLIQYLLSNKYLLLEEPHPISRTEAFINTFPNINYHERKHIIDKVNILVIGLGTAGSYILESLIKLGFQQFTIIDGDIVEEKNCDSQNYNINDIGCKKTTAIKNRYIDSATIKEHDQFVHNHSEINAITPVEQYDIVINCADDYQLLISLLKEKIQKQDYPIIIETGYSVLLQSAYLIADSKGANYFLDHAKKILAKREHFIGENSGSIINAFYSSAFVTNLIIDQVIQNVKTNSSFVYNFSNHQMIYNSNFVE